MHRRLKVGSPFGAGVDTMPQTVWKGSLSFGLVSLPVRMSASARKKGVSFRLLHVEDQAPVKNKRVCSVDGKELSSEEVVRGIEVGDDRFLTVTDEEIEAAKPESSSLLDVREFVDASAIDPIYHERTYVLTPQPGGEKVYELLRRVLERTNRAALATAAMREGEHLVAIRATDALLLADFLRFEEEVADLPTVEAPASISPEEEELAELIVDRMAKPFDPSKYEDAVEARLRALVDAKLRGAPPPSAAVKKEKPAADLVAALKQTLAAQEGHAKAAE